MDGKIMITLKELNPHGYTTTLEIDMNLAVLLDRLNQVRTAYNVPMIVTSGLRSLDDQLRINPLAPQSNHLRGKAADIADHDGKLKEWVNDNVALMESIGLWMESFDHTTTWVHFQTVAPRSGNRFFIP
jgi:uncharacterized protein YcbK (DUF882 family)